MLNKEFKSFLKTVVGNEGNKCHYPTRLDTYGRGCQHDCSYCYAKSLLDFRGLWNAAHPAMANMMNIARSVKRNLKPGDIVRLGGMTDCFQPLEKQHRITYRTIQVLNQLRVGYLIVTKSAMVADDEYLALYDKDLAHIQVTITTTDDEFSKTIEKASVPSKRIEAVEKLQQAGFDVSVRLSPFVPQFIEKGYLDMKVINKIQCDKILVEFLRINNWIKRWLDIDTSEYTVKQSNYRHLPLALKKKYIKLIKNYKEKTVCEDETEAYEYWKHHYNHNENDCCNLKI